MPKEPFTNDKTKVSVSPLDRHAFMREYLESRKALPPLPPLFTTFAEAPMSCDLAGGDKVKQER